MELISIIVPVYRAENYLDKCVQSIVDQTYRNLEIILVDDGSPDRSVQLCEDWAKKDSRIRVLRKPNGGAASARNVGIENSLGEWLMFIDSDDFVSADMVQKLYDAAQANGTKIAYCSLTAFVDDEDGYRELEFWSPPTPGICDGRAVLQNAIDQSQGLLGGYYVVPCNKIYHRSVWERLRFPEGQVHEDEVIAHHILNSCGKLVCINEALYYYRQHADSVMGKRNLLRALSIAVAYGDRILLFDRNDYAGNIDSLQKNYWGILMSLYTQFVRDKQCRNLLKKQRNQMTCVKRVYVKSTGVSWKKKTIVTLFCLSPELFGMLYACYVKLHG